VADAAELTQAIARVRHVRELSVEEFIDGEEYTFDTVSIAGRPAYYNIAWYRPRPLKARSEEWISPQSSRSATRSAAVAQGRRDGSGGPRRARLRVGFTHMEWYMKADGEVVFGEIGGRPPGAHQVDQMNYAATSTSSAAGPMPSASAVSARMSAGATTWRRSTSGRWRGADPAHRGLEEWKARHGAALVWENLLPVGAPRATGSRRWFPTGS